MTGNSPASSTSARAPRGRPFAKGNPGKPKGARARSARLLEALLTRDAELVVASVVKAACEGNITAARLILDRACKRPRAPAMSVKLPEVRTQEDLFAALGALTQAVSAGEMTAADAAAMAGVLDAQQEVAYGAGLDEPDEPDEGEDEGEDQESSETSDEEGRDPPPSATVPA